MLNSGKKFRALRDKKINILTLVLSEKKILNETKKLLFRKTASLFDNRVSSQLRSQIQLLFGLRCSNFLQLS